MKKNVRSRQTCITTNSGTVLSKTQFFPVGIVNKAALYIKKINNYADHTLEAVAGGVL